MHTFSGYKDAFIELNKRGFCHDFVLIGDDLLWIQEKRFIGEHDFSISECHQLAHPLGKEEDMIIFGINLFSAGIKGIMVNYYSYDSRIPGIITRKLNEMGFYSSGQNGG